ncbi:MAG: PilW family protein [Halioglobus sp.]
MSSSHPVEATSGNTWLAGTSLVELMIALLLAGFLSLAIVTVYLNVLRQFEVDEAMSALQENGRFALTLLTRELSHAGFYGAQYDISNLAPESVGRDCVTAGNWALTTDVPLDVVDNVGSSLSSAGGSLFNCVGLATVVPSSDVLTVKRTATDYTVADGQLRPGARVRNNQWYLRIADEGDSLAWFYHTGGGFPSVDLQAGNAVNYWAYNARLYYLRAYSEQASDNIPSLCVEYLAGGEANGAMVSRCLVEGVEDMQIEFGVDSDNDGTPNRFRTRPSATELSQIVSARVFLLLRSLQPIANYGEGKTYRLGSKTVSPEGKYLRRVFSTSVRIRNVS